MNRLRKNSCLILIGLTACFMVACSGSNKHVKNSENEHDDEVIQSAAEENVWDIKIISEQLNENLIAEANIELPKLFNGEVKVINSVLKELDIDKVIEILMPDEENIEQPVEGVYITEDKNINIGKYLSYSTQNVQYYSSIYSPEKCIENLALSFMEIDQAYQEVINTLKDIGVENITLKHVYSMDTNLMKQEEKIKMEDESFDEDLKNGRALYKGEWNDDDGCYVFEFEQNYNDIAILDNVYITSDDRCVFGGNVRVFFTKFGVESIVINAIYDKVSEEEASMTIEQSEALNLLKRKYDTIIMTDNMVVTNMKITYIPVMNDKSGDEFQLVPAWDFTIIAEGKQEAAEEYEIHIYFNAITGEEFLI